MKAPTYQLVKVIEASDSLRAGLWRRFCMVHKAFFDLEGSATVWCMSVCTDCESCCETLKKGRDREKMIGNRGWELEDEPDVMSDLRRWIDTVVIVSLNQ